MIFIKRDAALIPEKVLNVAQRAQNALEQLPAEQRKDFIKKSLIYGEAFQSILPKCLMVSAGILKLKMRVQISM